VAQWHSRSFPSLRRGFDSLHPLHPPRTAMDAYSLPGPDWFSSNIPSWQQLFAAAGAPRSVLEIGGYEGRATVWMGENLIAAGGEIVVVDHWRGSVTHDPAEMPDVEA